MIQSINSDIVRTYGHLDKQNSFTRKRKMSLDENRAFFGECSNNHSKGEVRASVSSIFDVFNHFFLDFQIDSIRISESQLTKKKY